MQYKKIKLCRLLYIYKTHGKWQANFSNCSCKNKKVFLFKMATYNTCEIQHKSLSHGDKKILGNILIPNMPITQRRNHR